MPGWHLTASWGEQWTQESCVLGSGHNVANDLGTRELCPNTAATAWTGGNFQCRWDLLEGTLQREWDFTAMKIQKVIRPAAAAAKSLQSCPTLWDPIDRSPPGSPVPGILQARTLEWVAISFSNAGKWKVKVKSLSRVRLLATPWTAVYQAPPSMGFSSQEYWSGVPLPSPTICKLTSIMSTGSWDWRTFRLYVKRTVCIRNYSFQTFSSVQFSSVTQSCPTLCDPMNCSTPALPVHHQLPEFTQTHVHWVSDSIQPSHPMSSPFPPARNPSQHQSLFQWVNSSHEVAKVSEFQL